MIIDTSKKIKMRYYAQYLYIICIRRFNRPADISSYVNSHEHYYYFTAIYFQYFC